MSWFACIGKKANTLVNSYTRFVSLNKVVEAKKY